MLILEMIILAVFFATIFPDPRIDCGTALAVRRYEDWGFFGSVVLQSKRRGPANAPPPSIKYGHRVTAPPGLRAQGWPMN